MVHTAAPRVQLLFLTTLPHHLSQETDLTSERYLQVLVFQNRLLHSVGTPHPQ